MRTYPKYIAALLLLALPFCAVAQRKKDQTLLWRISGKGMKKPSYLFGTLHVSDTRLFLFDDSVYAAIRNTDGLALEVNLNEVVACAVNNTFDEKSGDDIKLKDVLGDAELKKMEKPLAKKFRKEMEEITLKDVAKEKDRWVTDYFSKGEMPAYVDVYLYDLARRQGKWLGGIEYPGDLATLADGSDVNTMLVSDEHAYLEDMIQQYTDQDIDGISKTINHYDPLFRDTLLARRNVKMARRMDSLSTLRTMFFAIGAAHLKGDSGVINMLKARGFNVDPVLSRNKIFAKKYAVKEVPLAWDDVTDNDKLYKISMPGMPSSVKMYGRQEMKIMLELSNLSAYCAMVVTDPAGGGNRDSVFHAMAVKILGDDKIKDPEKTEHEGIQGAQYLQKHDNYVTRLQLYSIGNVLYAVWVYGKKEEYLKTDEAEQFFASLHFMPHTGDESKVFAYTDPVAGVTFNAPVKLEYDRALSEQTNVPPDRTIVFSTGQDEVTATRVLYMNKQPKPGYSIANDSTELEALAGYYGTKYNAGKKWTTVDGYRALEMEGDSAGTHIKMLSFIRGNRHIAVIFLAGKKNANQRMQQVFTSLKTIPYKQSPAWQVAADTAHTFTVMAPDTFRIKETGAANQFCQYSYDTLTAGNYTITVDTLSKYAWASNDSAFISNKINEYVTKNDSLIYEKKTGTGKDITADALIQKDHSNVVQRLRIVVHGNLQYNLSSCNEKAVLASGDADNFFGSFMPLTPVSFDLHEYRGTMLLDSLASTNPASRNEAYEGLSTAFFDKTDLPALHKALYNAYLPVAGSTNRYSINNMLARGISRLKDPSSIQFARDSYMDLAGARQPLKYATLLLLAQMETAESYAAIADLMQQSLPGNQDYAVLSALMAGNLPLLKNSYPALVKLTPDTAAGRMIVVFTATLLDKGMISASDISPAEKDFIAYAERTLPPYQKEDKSDWGVYHLLDILDSINTPATLHAMEQYCSAQNVYLKEKAALQLAIRDHKISPAIWDTLAADARLRITLYKDLKSIGKDTLFPATYLRQDLFARSVMYSAANEGNEELADNRIEFIGTDTLTANDRQYACYLYKLTYTHGQETVVRLGVAGGYDIAGNGVTPTLNIAGVYRAAPYTEAARKDQFLGFMKQQQDAAERKE